MAKTQYIGNGDGTMTIVRCDGTEEIIVICDDCGGTTGVNPEIPEPIETDNTACNVASIVHEEFLYRFRDLIDVIDATPLIEPVFTVAILGVINGTGLPRSGFADIRNWAYQVKIGLNPSQIKFYLDEIYNGTELSDSVFCLHVSCFQTTPVSVRSENINCIVSGLRALKDNPDYNNVLEAMAGLYPSIPLSFFQEYAFNASLAPDRDCSSCVTVVPQGCENIVSSNLVTFEWNDQKVAGGISSCYANGQFSGGVCPNSLLGSSGFEITFPTPICVNHVFMSAAGTSSEAWEKADLYIDDVKVATSNRGQDIQGGTRCANDIVADPPPYSFPLSGYISGKKFRVVGTEKTGSNVGAGIYLHCFKLNIGQVGA